MIYSETRLITFFGESFIVEAGAKVWVIERGKRTGSKSTFET